MNRMRSLSVRGPFRSSVSHTFCNAQTIILNSNNTKKNRPIISYEAKIKKTYRDEIAEVRSDNVDGVFDAILSRPHDCLLRRLSRVYDIKYSEVIGIDIDEL